MDKLIERVRKGGRLVVVLRGVSGSGKSTLADTLEREALLTAPTDGREVLTVSADDYFTDKDGGYHFDPSKLGDAHGLCLRRFTNFLLLQTAHGAPEALVVVDNTHTTVAEAAPYMALAAAYGFEALLVTLDFDPRKAAARNVHGVSTEGVDAQYQRLTAETRRLPPFWECLEVLP